jgi:hypothetical protein
MRMSELKTAGKSIPSAIAEIKSVQNPEHGDGGQQHPTRSQARHRPPRGAMSAAWGPIAKCSFSSSLESAGRARNGVALGHRPSGL